MDQASHRWRAWMMNVAGLAVVVLLYGPLGRLFAAHPAALWIATGVMLFFMFVKAYQRELEKRRRDEA